MTDACVHCGAPMVDCSPTPRGEAPTSGVYIAGEHIRPAWLAGRRLIVQDHEALELDPWVLTCCRERALGDCVGVRVRRGHEIVDELATWWDAVPVMQARWPEACR